MSDPVRDQLALAVQGLKKQLAKVQDEGRILMLDGIATIALLEDILTEAVEHEPDADRIRRRSESVQRGQQYTIAWFGYFPRVPEVAVPSKP